MLPLYELISLLPSNAVVHLPPRLANLLAFLKSHTGLTKAQGAEQYLGDIKKKAYFGKLVYELKKALIRHIVATASLAKNSHKAMIEDCHRNMAIYKMLLLNNKREAAIEIAEALLPALRKLELHSLAHTVANDLLFHYSVMDTSVGLSKKYTAIAAKELELVKAEAMVRAYHSRVGLLCNTRESFTTSIVEEVTKAAEHSVPLLRLGSHHLTRLIYTIVMSRYIIVYEYENVIKTCDEALSSFPADHPNGRSLRFLFLCNKIAPLVSLGRTDEAKEIARSAGELVPAGNYNWHMALQRRITVCLHSSEYQEAYDLYKAHSKYKPSAKEHKEYWSILEGFLYFLIKRELVKPYENERFSIGKFMNEVPLYSKDKAGNNINILIIQILVWMERGQFGRVIDRTESLREYARKYTRNPETKRANLFIQMILRMEGAQFHRARTETKTNRLRQQLDKTPLCYGQNLAVEIIPYPVLWEEILSMLRDQPRARTVRKTPAR